MRYEIVSRALAYVSCLSTTSLFLTAMAIVAVNVGKLPSSACVAMSCSASQTITKTGKQAQSTEALEALLLKKKLKA